MDLELLETFGKVDNKCVILNNEEYAFMVGSVITVKKFKPTQEKTNKYLRSKESNFCAMDYNAGILIVCESGRNASLKAYSYSQDDGFSFIAQINIPKTIEITSISIFGDGSRVACLLPEPLFQLKVFEFVNKRSFKELISVNLDYEYSRCKFSPMNKNMIFNFHAFKCSVVEIKDSFPEDYQTQFDNDVSNPQTIKQEEEDLLKKRSEIFVLDREDVESFVDFVWDTYNNIYLATSNENIFLYDSAMTRVSFHVQDESRECCDLDSKPLCLLLSQRYLLCALENGVIAMINLYIHKKELPQYKQSLGIAENYKILTVDKQVNVLNNKEDITFMKFYPNFQRILVGTESDSLYTLFLQGEVLIKENDKEENAEANINTEEEIDCTEELRFHKEKVLGVRELGSTTQFISVGVDKKVIIWEICGLMAKYVHPIKFEPTAFEVDETGNLVFIGSKEGVMRVYDISTRSQLKLINQMKYTDNTQIDKIVIGPKMKFILFYKRYDRMIYFISGETNRSDTHKNFIFLGYLKTLANVLDVAVHNETEEVIVLTKQLLFSYIIKRFIYDHKEVYEIKPKKEKDCFVNFELKHDIKVRKVDSDLNVIIKNSDESSIWLSGSDMYLRLYNMPVDTLENVKESKRPPDNPLEDITGHNLDITAGQVHKDVLITGSADGSVQMRKDKLMIRQYHSHSFIHQGINSLYYSPQRNLIYVTGYDGSIFIFAEDENVELPLTLITPDLNSEMMDFESINSQEDSLLINIRETIKEDHNNKIKLSKKNSQAVLKQKIEDIKTDLYKHFLENSRLEKWSN